MPVPIDLGQQEYNAAWDEANKPNYGLRPDGTPKGQGWLGPMQRPDGRVSSEISVGVNIGGKEMDIPSMVPTLDKNEIQYLLNTPLSPDMWKTPVGQGIMQKAHAHATERIGQGLSPFKD